MIKKVFQRCPVIIEANETNSYVPPQNLNRHFKQFKNVTHRKTLTSQLVISPPSCLHREQKTQNLSRVLFTAFLLRVPTLATHVTDTFGEDQRARSLLLAFGRLKSEMCA